MSNNCADDHFVLLLSCQELKAAIQKALGIPSHQQRLLRGSEDALSGAVGENASGHADGERRKEDENLED